MTPARPARAWWRAGLCVLLAACRQGGTAEDSFFDPELEPPEITRISLDCDLEAGRYRIEVVTDAWAGGASVVWTVDGDYVERHDNFRSIRAGPNGWRDELRADVSMVDDFRPAGSGGNTAFTCRDDVNALVWVTDLDDEVSDCRHFGPDPTLVLDLEDNPPCPLEWVFE
jgi:hypothetical protein